ncbi:MAG: hypothetical protein Q4C00_05915 [Bacillota bacterium]|nr:hypothetical protein [Bacillota bacterium]
MKINKLLILCLAAVIATFAVACNSDSSSQGKYYLSPNETNYFVIEENPQDLSALGQAINNTENMLVALDASSADYILNSLDSIGEVEAENLTMEFNLNGKGDYGKLADLSTIKGLTAVTIAGINDFKDASVFQSLSDLTTLTLKDQDIDDFSPLNQCPNLSTLSLSGETISYTTLMSLKVENINIPVKDDNWVALTQLKANESLNTINTVDKDLFNVSEYLEDEQKYYYLQFADVIYMTQKKQAITTAADGAPQAIKGNMAVASAPGLLQPSYYSNQQLLNTACGFSEDDTNAPVFFPYILDYTAAGSDSTYLKLSGTNYMNENFITAVDTDNAKYITYIYATTEDGSFTTDYSQGQLWIYAQIYDIEDNLCYSPALIYQSALGEPENAENYQGEIIGALNTYLSSIPVDTL